MGNDNYLDWKNGDLGPKNVDPNFRALLHGYDRLGGLTPDKFLEEWQKNGQSGSWNWPNDPQGGFVCTITNNTKTPIAGVTKIQPGTYIDRFGNEDRVYFAPFGTPYRMRSLSPDILWAKYTVYKVVKEFEAKVGPIEPGFEQPGYGTQIVAVGWKRADNMCDDKTLARVVGEELGMLMKSLE